MSSCYWLKNEEFTAYINATISPFCGVKLHCIYYSIYLIITGTLFNVKTLYNCEHQAFSVRRLDVGKLVYFIVSQIHWI